MAERRLTTNAEGFIDILAKKCYTSLLILPEKGYINFVRSTQIFALAQSSLQLRGGKQVSATGHSNLISS